MLPVQAAQHRRQREHDQKTETLQAKNIAHLATAAAATMGAESATSGSMASLSRVRTHKPTLPVVLAARAMLRSKDLRVMCKMRTHDVFTLI